MLSTINNNLLCVYLIQLHNYVADRSCICKQKSEISLAGILNLDTSNNTNSKTSQYVPLRNGSRHK